MDFKTFVEEQKKQEYYMTLKEKMDFLGGVHTNNVPLFDEDGDDMDTFDDYTAIRDEFLNHPEQFSLNNILDMIDIKFIYINEIKEELEAECYAEMMAEQEDY